MSTADINTHQIDGILEVDPTGELCRKLLKIFENEFPPLLNNLRDSLKNNNNELSAQIVHSIRSSCLNIGAQRLADDCLHLENDLNNNKNHQENVTLVLQEGFEYTVQKIKEYLSNILKSKDA